MWGFYWLTQDDRPRPVYGLNAEHILTQAAELGAEWLLIGDTMAVRRNGQWQTVED